MCTRAYIGMFYKLNNTSMEISWDREIAFFTRPSIIDRVKEAEEKSKSKRENILSIIIGMAFTNAT